MVKIRKKADIFVMELLCIRAVGHEIHCSSLCPLLEPGYVQSNDDLTELKFDRIWTWDNFGMTSPAIRINCGCTPIIWPVEILPEDKIT